MHCLKTSHAAVEKGVSGDKTKSKDEEGGFHTRQPVPYYKTFAMSKRRILSGSIPPLYRKHEDSRSSPLKQRILRGAEGGKNVKIQKQPYQQTVCLCFHLGPIYSTYLIHYINKSESTGHDSVSYSVTLLGLPHVDSTQYFPSPCLYICTCYISKPSFCL